MLSSSIKKSYFFSFYLNNVYHMSNYCLGDMDNTLERIRVGDMDLYSVPNTPVFDALR